MPRIWEEVILPQSTWVQQEGMESPDTDMFISVPFHREADSSTADRGKEAQPRATSESTLLPGKGQQGLSLLQRKAASLPGSEGHFFLPLPLSKRSQSGLRACSVSTFSCSLHTRRGAALQGTGPPLSSSPFPFGLACQRSSRGCIWPGNDMLTPLKSWVKIHMRVDRSRVWHGLWVCSSRHWGCTLQV